MVEGEGEERMRREDNGERRKGDNSGDAEREHRGRGERSRDQVDGG
jgi:hypothetical protein